MGVLNSGFARLASGAALGAVIILGFTLLPSPTRLADADPIIIAPPTNAPMSFADLIEQVSPAVVSIYVKSEVKAPSLRFPGIPNPFEEFDIPGGEDDDDNTRPSRSQGSGFFISDDGFIVTNHHVIENAIEIEVKLEDDRLLKAEIVGADPETDLAVLKVNEDETFPYVSFNQDDDIRRGDWVVSVGNPLGLGGTATAGIVSAEKRSNIMGSSGTYVDYIQLDAPINKGNSGGPTFDLRGRVIGVNTSIYSPTGGSIGIGFAIQSKQAKTITDLLIKNGKVTRGWLGVTIQNFSEEMAESQGLDKALGAIITGVRPNSPAEEGGLENGDVILAVNGIKGKDSRQITRLVGALIAGTENTFDIIRRGKEMQIMVTVAERPSDLSEDRPTLSTKPNTSNSEEAPFGLQVKKLGDSDRKKLDLDRDVEGLLITKVDPKSPFASYGISAGMAILEVNHTKVSDVATFTKALRAAKDRGRANVLVTIRSAQGSAYTAISLEGFEE